MKVICWFSIIYCLFLLGCERALPFPETKLPPVLVANAIFATDSLWQVQLSESATIDSSVIFSSITNGQVQIKDLEEETIIQLTHQKKGIYTAGENLPKTGNRYQLMAQAEGFPYLQSIDYVPNDFSINLVNFQPAEYQKVPNYLFDLEIIDDPTLANYYLFEIDILLETKDGDFLERAGHFSLDSNSDNEEVAIDHFNLKKSYLSDENFNGQTYLTQIGATSELLNQISDNDQLFAIIRIKSMSEAGYLYEKSIARIENFEEELFTDPVGVFSNVEGGLGIFVGINEQKLVVRLK